MAEYEITPEAQESSGLDTPNQQKRDSLIPLSVSLIILVLVFAIGSVTLLALASPLEELRSQSTQSEEERYYHINDFLKEIDYQSAGEITSEGYDNLSASKLNPARFEAIFSEEASFGILKERTERAIGDKCSFAKDAIRCVQNRPTVAIVQKADGTVILDVRD